MKGRKPKPTAIKKLAGNPGKRPLNKNEPKLTAKVLRVPDFLPDHAKKEWRRLARLLGENGIVTEADRAALTGYCIAWGRYVQAEENLKESSMILVTDKGYQYQNPWLSISNKAAEEMRKWAVELGMTPSSRSRVQAINGNDKTASEMLRESLFARVLVADETENS